MNRVELRGGLTTDPTVDYLPSGDPMVAFTLAVNGTRWSRQDNAQVVKTSYVRCRMYSDIAIDILNDPRGFGKGDDVYVLGELDQIEVPREGKAPEKKTGVTVFQLTVVRRKRQPKPAEPPVDPWAK